MNSFCGCFFRPGKNRRLLLTRQSLSIYSGRTEKANIPIWKLLRAELAGSSSSETKYFSVHLDKKSYHFQAPSAQDAIEWVNSIMKLKSPNWKEVRNHHDSIAPKIHVAL
jgi:hypothetical protein